MRLPRTTVSKLPYDVVWTLPERHTTGQFLIGIVLLCSVARQEGKHLIVFSKEARAWREEQTHNLPAALVVGTALT
jgi:hypothetical protein